VLVVKDHGAFTLLEGPRDAAQERHQRVGHLESKHGSRNVPPFLPR